MRRSFTRFTQLPSPRFLAASDIASSLHEQSHSAPPPGINIPGQDMLASFRKQVQQQEREEEAFRRKQKLVKQRQHPHQQHQPAARQSEEDDGSTSIAKVATADARKTLKAIAAERKQLDATLIEIKNQREQLELEQRKTRELLSGVQEQVRAFSQHAEAQATLFDALQEKVSNSEEGKILQQLLQMRGKLETKAAKVVNSKLGPSDDFVEKVADKVEVAMLDRGLAEELVDRALDRHLRQLEKSSPAGSGCNSVDKDSGGSDNSVLNEIMNEQLLEAGIVDSEHFSPQVSPNAQTAPPTAAVKEEKPSQQLQQEEEKAPREVPAAARDDIATVSQEEVLAESERFFSKSFAFAILFGGAAGAARTATSQT